MDNNALFSLVPRSLLVEMGSLRELSLAGNKLRGPLPDLSPAASLTLLDASRNGFTGTLPEELAALSSLQVRCSLLPPPSPSLGSQIPCAALAHPLLSSLTQRSALGPSDVTVAVN